MKRSREVATTPPEHRHKAQHRPKGGTGYAVCACGATRRYGDGYPVGHWHSCPLCVPAAFLTHPAR